MVGQIAKIKGCRAVGIAGGAEKCRYVVEDLGFDAAIDYKGEDVGRALRRDCPDGIDVYFDNVGGEILDAALARLARGARVPICGAISQYNATEAIEGPANYLSLLVSRASMTGFLVFDYADRFDEAAAEMAGWMASGSSRRVSTSSRAWRPFPRRCSSSMRARMSASSCSRSHRRDRGKGAALDLKLGLNTGYWAGGPPPGIGQTIAEAETLGLRLDLDGGGLRLGLPDPARVVGRSTERLKLGTAIVQMSARQPAATAMAAMTIDHLSGGRFILGLGVSGPQVVEGWYGMPFAQAAGAHPRVHRDRA